MRTRGSSRRNILQTTTLNDFKDAETNLTLELDELKSQWSQSAEFSKSVRSRIKSLEDSKLLSDLKAKRSTGKWNKPG